MSNQRGGIISKVFLVPAGALVVVVVFLLGYYTGRHVERKAAEGEKPPTLPELADQYLPKKEDLTFYKTLTERGEKTVSVDLKAKQKEEKTAGAPQPAEQAKAGEGGKQKQEKPLEVRIDRKAAPQKTAEKPKQASAKKETAATSATSSKLRYTVQVASYPDRALAEESMKSMKKKGYAAFIVASELGGKATWYRVRLGSFGSRASA